MSARKRTSASAPKNVPAVKGAESPPLNGGRKRQKLRQISVRVDDANWNMFYAVNAKLGEVEKRNLSFNHTLKYAMAELYEKLHGKPFRA